MDRIQMPILGTGTNPYSINNNPITTKVPNEVGQMNGGMTPSPRPAEYEPFFISNKTAQLEKLGKVADEKMLKRLGIVECATCAARRYQDGSNDPGVSFKTPTHLSPENATAAVMAHEQEHVVRNQAEAKENDREILSQTVTLHSSICPECGKVYTSGGTTKTVTAGRSSPNAYSNQSPQTGQLLDFKL